MKLSHLVLAVLLGVISGCAATATGQYAECKATNIYGQCTEWYFGPSKAQWANAHIQNGSGK